MSRIISIWISGTLLSMLNPSFNLVSPEISIPIFHTSVVPENSLFPASTFVGRLAFTRQSRAITMS